MTERDEYVETVLATVERIPPGRVTTYGAIAAVLGSGARQVGWVMAHHGGPVPWWRVVRSDGSLPASHRGEAERRYAAEGTPVQRGGAVDMREAFWDPDPDWEEIG
jgi:alkylated DNA nucleotide flippase Atl1